VKNRRENGRNGHRRPRRGRKAFQEETVHRKKWFHPGFGVPPFDYSFTFEYCGDILGNWEYEGCSSNR
jgi:hypothetical protein